MSTKTDIVNLVVRVNGDQAKKEYTELKASAAQISAELKGMKKGTEEYIAKSRELKEVESRLSSLRSQMDLNSLSLKDLHKEIKKMKMVRAELDPASDAFKALTTQIDTAQARMKDLNEGGSFLSKTFDFLRKEAMAFGVVMLTALGLDYVIGKVGDLIKKNAELSDSLSAIRKTTGMSQEAVEELNKSLSKIDTRTAKKELLAIAAGLGQIGQEATIESIENIDKIVVALGDEFGTSAKEITESLSILRNNFDEFKGSDYGDDILHIGNALNHLGATGLATAPVVTDFATRMSGVLNQFGIGIGKTLGISAAMQELGINVERGSTAVTKLVQKMAQSPEVFAKVAGAKTNEEIKAFVQLVNDDAVAALMKVAQGAKEAGKSNTEFAAILKELESTGAGVGEVLAKFAANTELVNNRINDASQAMTQTNSITEEFALVNDNLAGKVEKLKKQFASLFVSESFNKFITSGINGAISFIKWLKDTGAWLERNAYWIKALVVAYATYYIASGRLVAMKTIEIAISKAKTLALIAENFAVNAVVLTMRVLTREITLATAAQRIYNAVVAMNPIVAITTALAALTIGLSAYIRKMQDAKYAQDALLDTKKLEADLQYRSEVFKAENASFLKDMQNGNAGQLKINQAALDAAQSIRMEEVRQLKSQFLEKQKIAEQTKRWAEAVGIKGFVDKSEAEMKKDKEVAENAKKNLEDAQAKYEDYAKIREQISKKLLEINNSQKQKEQELTEKLKAEYDKRKKDLEKYLEDVKRANQELEQLNKQVERAKIEAIEETNAREILFLEQSHKEKIEAINKQIEAEKTKINALIQEGKRLGQNTIALNDELLKLDEKKNFLLLGNEEAFQREIAALKKKQKDDAENSAYQEELKKLNDNIATQKLLYSQLYKNGEIDKYTHDQKLIQLDIDSKKQLLALANKYGVQVTQAAQDLTDAEIKIMEDAVTRKKALQQLDQEFAQAERSRRTEMAGEYIGFFNNMAQQIFDFRSQKLDEELALVQSKAAKEQADTEQQYKNKLLADVEYNSRKKANQDKLDKAEKEAKRKKAINDKVAALFNIGISTAQAIMQAMVNPFPLNIIQSAMAGTMGAIQMAFVAAQKTPQYFKGGYTKVVGQQDNKTYDAKILPNFGSGYVSNPSILVGERGKEYVVNNTALGNPTVSYITDAIDALSNGKISQMDFNSMFAMPALQQRYTGGYTDGTTSVSATTTASNGSSVASFEIQEKMFEVFSKLNAHLDKGIHAKIGDRTIVDFNERNDYLKSIVEDAS